MRVRSSLMDPRIALVSPSLMQQRCRKQKSRAQRPGCKATAGFCESWVAVLQLDDVSLCVNESCCSQAKYPPHNLRVVRAPRCRCCVHNKAAPYDGRLVPHAGCRRGGGAPWKWWYQLLLVIPRGMEPTLGLDLLFINPLFVVYMKMFHT